MDGLAGNLGQVPPTQVGQHWGSSLGTNHGESMGTGVEELGVSSHSLAMPSARKSVRPGGNVGSSPNSLSTSKLTCFR